MSILLKAHTWLLDLLKMYVALIRRYSTVDEKPRYGYDIEVVIIRIGFDNLISRMRFVDHVPR